MDKKFFAVRAEWVAAIILSVIFGFLCILPNIVERFDKDYGYQGVVMMPTDQEFYYGGRAAAVGYGDWPVANQYYESPKDQPYVQPAFPEAVIVFTGRVFGFEPLTSFILSKFIFGMLLTIVLFGFWTSVIKKPWMNLIVIATVLFANAALSAPWDIFRFIETGIFSNDFLRFSRPINPQWSATWFFFTLWILSLWMQDRSSWKAVLIGICAGIMLFSYVYAWTYLGAVLALLLLWYAYKKQWKRVTDILIIGIVFLLLGIPYLMNMWELIHHPWYPETAARQGLIEKRFFVFGMYSIAFIIAAFPSKKILPKSWPLLPMLAIGGFIVLNQQMITGRAIVLTHYHWYFIQPLSAMLLLTILFFACMQIIHSSRLRMTAGGIVLFGAIGFGMLQQAQAYVAAREEWSEYQSFGPVFQKLNEVGEKHQVVFAGRDNGHIRDLITVHTPLSAYMAGNANGYLTPVSRARDAMFFELWLEDLSAEEAGKRFPTDMRAFVSSRLFSIYYREFTGQYELIPDDIIDEQIEKYAEYLSLSSREKLTLYPLHFAIRTSKDPDTDGWKNLRSIGTEIYSQSGTSIIQFTR